MDKTATVHTMGRAMTDAVEVAVDSQTETVVKDTVASNKTGVKDLNAFVLPCVVFGNVGKKNNYEEFKPDGHGVKPLSVMAVVRGDKMVGFACASLSPFSHAIPQFRR